MYDDDEEYHLREADRQRERRIQHEMEGGHFSKVEDDDNNSNWSWEGVSDDVDDPLSPNQLATRPLGLSRRAGYTSYDDYDVITVHGARDDPQTAWTSPHDNSNWILDKLFHGKLVRQMDYVYDTSDTARIYDPNADGIAIEANDLLHSLAQNRIELPTTEDDRPIIWICHDLGGSIVKQALVNAMYKQPEIDPEDLEDLEYSMAFRRMYRRLPLLTSSIIFLGCPHNAKSNEDLVDQLFAMMLLPGPVFRTQAMNKIRNLARQIETGNLEFLESKVPDRALIVNVSSGPEQHKSHSTDREHQKGPHTVEEEIVSIQEANHPFSSYIGQMFPNLEMFHAIRVEAVDHLGLVRGTSPKNELVREAQADWVQIVSHRFQYGAYVFENNVSLLAFQNSLLSLSPPTQAITHTHQCRAGDGTNLRVPGLIAWIMQHSFFETRSNPDLKPQTLYLHTGNKGHMNIKLISRQLCVAYDAFRNERHRDIRTAHNGCFYFEFDRHDSRRNGVKALVTSFICTLACRFWRFEPEAVRMSVKYLTRYQSWTLMDLINLFVIVLERCHFINMTIMLVQFDHLKEFEGRELFKAISVLQWRIERPIRFIITTTRPLDLKHEDLRPHSVISLDDCPLSLDESIYPEDYSTAEDSTQRLTKIPTETRRPKSAQMAPKLNRMFKKLGKLSSSQDQPLEEPPRSRPETPNHGATGSVQEPSAGTHQKLLRGILDQLTEPTQRIMRRVYSWIRHSAEPLTQQILAQAIQISLPQEMEQLGMNQGPQGFVEFVQQTMRGIIVLEGRDLRFSDDAFYDVSGSGMFQDEEKQANRSHADMATVCLRYLLGSGGQEMLRSLSVENHGLNDHDLNWSPVMLPRHDICSYALRFWTVHYRASGSYRPAELASELFQDERKMRVWTEALYVISNPFNRIQREYISPLPYMAMHGLDDLVRRHIQTEGKYSGLNQDHWLAVVEAARNEHRKTVVILVKHADRNMAGLAEAIAWAARSDFPGAQEAALDVLISEAQQVKNFCWPPFILNRAVAGSHDDLLSALIKSGYDPNERDSTGEATAVHNAIMLGRHLMLDDLLKCGRVDIKLKSRCLDYSGQMVAGYSPLANALSGGMPFVIPKLIDAGANFSPDSEPYDCFMNGISRGSHRAVASAVKKPIPQQWISEGLGIAAHKGFAQCVRRLLDNGADPNYVSTSQHSALYEAVAGGRGASVEACRLLLEKGADPNQCNVDRVGRKGVFSVCREPPTLLILAIVLRKAPLVSMLLDYGAKINGVDPDAGADLPLSVALIEGDMESVNLLLERGADPNLGCAGPAPGASPPLLVACYFHAERGLVEKLIEYGVNLRSTITSEGSFALHCIARGDRALPLLPLLLKHGADINATDNSNYTPLMVAAESGSTKFAELLLKQTDPKPDLEVISTRDPSRTALHLALRAGHPEIVKLLLEAGADIDRQMSNGRFPLGQLLASDELQPLCEDLIEFTLKKKPNLGLADDEGNTVLHNIRSDTPLSVVVRLVVEGAPVDTYNERGYNPLACAVECGNTNVARYLTTVRGVQCDVYHPSFGSILHLAAANSTLDVVRQLVRTGAEHSVVNPAFGESVLYSTVGNENKKELRNIVRYLVEEVGIDVDALGGRWVSSLLRTVVEAKGTHLLKYLLIHGARTDQVDFLGRAAVHWAVINQRLRDLETLVEFGADISVVDKFERSSLHFAASKEDLSILRYVLEKLPHGASNDNAADVDGWTPLMWATRSGSSMAFALIDEYEADTCARSKDAEWSPLKIARLCGWDEEDVEGLKRRIGAQGREEAHLSQDDETKPGAGHEQICIGCDMACIGEIWSCADCQTYLCFKCIGHSAKMHDPDHTFVDMETQLEAEEELGEDVDEIENEGGSETGSEDEEQEETGSETETESEEEEEDDSD